MADNQALKLLMAGIVGAVIGAAASDRYHFPAGSVFGSKQTGSQQRSRAPALINSASAGERPADDPPRIMRSAPRSWPDWPEAGGPPRWRGARASGSRPALCWREYEDWNFGTVGHYVRCSSSRKHRAGAG
jgi:hypothetical protein